MQCPCTQDDCRAFPQMLMYTFMKLLHVSVALCLVWSLTGCQSGRPSLTQQSNLPDELFDKLLHAEHFEIAALWPWTELEVGAGVEYAWSDTLAGFGVLESVQISDRSQRRMLLSAFQNATPPEWGAACCVPRHGLRVKDGESNWEIAVCFECASVRTRTTSDSSGRWIVSGEREFERLFRQHGLIAAPAGPPPYERPIAMVAEMGDDLPKEFESLRSGLLRVEFCTIARASEFSSSKDREDLASLPNFHAWVILDSVQLHPALEGADVINALLQAVRDGEKHLYAKCYEPHHALRVLTRSGTQEYAICFLCHNYRRMPQADTSVGYIDIKTSLEPVWRGIVMKYNLRDLTRKADTED